MRTKKTDHIDCADAQAALSRYWAQTQGLEVIFIISYMTIRFSKENRRFSSKIV